ncbi:MAG: NADH-quinone oxidoreductase subunit L [candidate division WOR-3 bacterium]|nr:NADH-quinone oxidoreductase subunit L [candidate division WOR-3 bacterium]
MLDLAILITLLSPLFGFLINGIFGKYIYRASGWIATSMLLISSVFGIYILIEAISKNLVYEKVFYTWIVLDKIKVDFGILIDNLSAIMIFVVTFVSFWIHFYSIEYMKKDESYARYFAYLNLFVFAMLLLVMANNYLLMFVGWEGVGLASYLLIGFWYKKRSATDAGNKAFIVNRIGDAGYLLGIFLIFTYFLSFNYLEIFKNVSVVEKNVLTLIGILLFIGATGKSAQFPLYTWLPDAMEGPTPVSALIHAATMVTAGVYMVARSSPIYSLSPEASFIVAFVGAFSAVLAATMALVNNDIKRIIAYSTISQIGYMFVGVGVGAYWAGIFHLYTHAFFKALLFLGAGSVMHALKDNLDIRLMGGLYKKMKITWLTFLIGSLALAGIFPLAGFFSKDKIIEYAYISGYSIVFYLVIFGVFLTAFYTFRLFFLVFHTKPRDESLYSIAHESPKIMTIPMIVLAIFSIIGGFVYLQFENALSYLPHIKFQESHLHIPIPAITLTLSLLGIVLAFFMYQKPIIPSFIGNLIITKLIYNILYQRWGILSDWYEMLVLRLLRKFSGFSHRFFDILVISGLDRAFAYTGLIISGILRFIQDAKFSTYIILIALLFTIMVYIVILS